MHPYYAVKHTLKRVRWQMRRGYKAALWGVDTLNATPIIFGNAMPKSGSHLIHQILLGLAKIGPFIDTGFPPLNRSEQNLNLSTDSIVDNLNRMLPGDIGYGYFPAKEPYLDILMRLAFANIFVYRDPRDMLVSHVFYATEIHKGHGMYPYYQKLDNTAARIAAAISGVNEKGFELSSVRERYDAYTGWLTQPGVLSLRFEDLRLQTEKSLNELLDFLATRGFTPKISRAESVHALQASISPKKSGTFRKGQPGNWREHFSEANQQLFKQKTGDLLVMLGYEKDNNW